MSAAQDSTLPPLRRMSNWIPPIQVQPPTEAPIPEQGRIVFTRQLWQRTMPEDLTEHGVSTRSQSQGSLSAHQTNTNISRRASSNVSTRSPRRDSSPSGGSKTPLTPEESPPFRSTRKRSAVIVEQEDKEIDIHDVSPAHTRVNSGDSTSQVCICQPDPKIPRPRNAFILYRQHHQAKVVSQHPGLANPEISKIIGEQWRNQSPEVKNEWKALAEEEKLRHQQQYPTYRYQPKRNGRRNSISSDTPGSAHGEKPKCTKCGGRSILAASTPYTHASTTTSPSTAGLPPGTPGLQTPVTRTLPVLRDLSLQSPALRRTRHYNMSPSNHYLDERDDLGPLSPDIKRRRFNGDQPATMQRQMPPRYTVAPQAMPVGPGTPFPFGAAPQQPHQFASSHIGPQTQIRRESLPGLRGMVSPAGPMPPPPRPGMGYQQHRLSNGHDRSLTLPPLQTGSTSGSANAPAKASASKSTEETIAEMPFSYKLNVLRKIAPPKALKKESPRGPLIAVEGENPEAVRQMAKWLAETLGRDSELNVKLLESPDVMPKGGREDAMAEYHLLAAQWLSKSKDILRDLDLTTAALPSSTLSGKMDTSTTSTPTVASVRAQSRELNENYDDSDSGSKSGTEMQVDTQSNKPCEAARLAEAMDLDKLDAVVNEHTTATKPITILPLFSLHASNTFALRIPLTDPYAPSDHWQWSATQWRGVVGPDLTIYLRDGEAGVEKGKLVEQIEEEGLFVVRKSEQSGMGVDGATLRRVGFEVGEWVRAFGVAGN